MQRLPLSVRRCRGCAPSPGSARAPPIAILAQTGLDMSRFPTPGHLACGPRSPPQANESAGKTRGSRSTGKGNPLPRRRAGAPPSWDAAAPIPSSGARYRRLVKRRGKSRAIVAVSRSILIAVGHILSQPGTTYLDLGP